ncbi:hypothetical protein Hanom_Chr03g00249801 [Helianthus anomalus]
MHEVVRVLSSILPAPKHNPTGPTVLLPSSKVELHGRVRQPQDATSRQLLIH